MSTELPDPNWTLDQQRGEAVSEAACQLSDLVLALIKHSELDPFTKAIAPRLYELSGVIIRAFDGADVEEMLVTINGPRHLR